MSQSTNEMNFLVHRYLEESGFAHSAYLFSHEAQLEQSNIDGSLVPPATLISIVQKGVKFVEGERPVDNSGQRPIGGLSLMEAITDPQQQNNLGDLKNEIKIPQSRIKIMDTYEKYDYSCAWNPRKDVLASHTDDYILRLWNMDDPSLNKEIGCSIVEHIFSLDWNCEGSLLAAGCADGFGRIWTTDGRLVSKLEHDDSVNALKWNKKGNYLLSHGNRTVSIWNASTGACQQQFAFHTASVHDVDWQSNDTFASCSNDKKIHVCQLDLNRPVKTFVGHTRSVTRISWCPTGRLLASCSSDKSLKVWSLLQDTPVYDFRGIDGSGDCIINWSNTGPGTANPNLKLMLASDDDDCLRLWDMDSGWMCMHNPMPHSGPINSVAFSPDGLYLASSCCDKRVRIWSTLSGQLVKWYEGKSKVYKLSWNGKGDKIGMLTEHKAVVVLDMRK